MVNIFTAFLFVIIIHSMVVFVGFAYFYLGESLRWNYVVSFLCILAAVVFGFWGSPAQK